MKEAGKYYCDAQGIAEIEVLMFRLQEMRHITVVYRRDSIGFSIPTSCFSLVQSMILKALSD